MDQNSDGAEEIKSAGSSNHCKQELNDKVSGLDDNHLDAAEVAKIKAEALKSVAMEFDKLDLNGDGNLSKSELYLILKTQIVKLG